MSGHAMVDRECARCGGWASADGVCAECAAREAEERARAKFVASCWGGDRAWREFTLERFLKTEHNAEAREAAVGWAGARGRDLYIWGNTGAGKTHLAVAAARRYWPADRPYRVVWKLGQIVRAVRAAGSAYEETAIIDRLVGQPLMLLDDLGVEKRTEFSDAVLYELVDGRDNAGRGGLAVTSNLSLDQLADFMGSDRVPSRLVRASVLVDLTGERDNRLPGILVKPGEGAQ